MTASRVDPLGRAVLQEWIPAVVVPHLGLPADTCAILLQETLSPPPDE